MPKPNIFDFTIVGAGLSGLTLGANLKKKLSTAKLRIFEKSNGSGGRMATRRSGDWTFDHGAQYIRECQDSEVWIHFWREQGVALNFQTQNLNGICGRSGMTRLAKILANALDVSYETKVTRLQFINGLWTTLTDQGQTALTKNLVLTCPLPQSLEILKNSNIDFDPELASIEYAQACVLLIELDSVSLNLPLYQENISPDIFSACSQHLKGTSAQPALTIVMTDHFSQSYFDSTDEGVIVQAMRLIKSHLPKLEPRKISIKRWKYSHPKKIWPKPFESIHSNLYLAGDAFGGASLVGALKSSKALSEVLIDRF